MPSLFIYAKVVMPIAVMLRRGEGQKKEEKSFDSRIRIIGNDQGLPPEWGGEQ